MRRRAFMAGLGSAAAWPLAARAQQPRKVRRIGFIAGGERPRPEDSYPYGAFIAGLKELGYEEGRDFVVEWRFAQGQYERLPVFAAEFTAMPVDVIVLSTAAAIRPVMNATNTIPAVMGSSTDPVGSGFVASLARPGANITGLATSIEDIAPKQVELLLEVIPGMSRVGVLINPNSPNYRPILRNIEAAAATSGIGVVPAQARSPDEIGGAFVRLHREGAQAVIAVNDAMLFAQRAQIAAYALERGLPSMFARHEYVIAGGLMSYGESLAEFLRRAASFVDKIFKGASPADLPIEQPTRFHLVINLKTAGALRLTVPPLILARADEVIE